MTLDSASQSFQWLFQQFTPCLTYNEIVIDISTDLDGLVTATALTPTDSAGMSSMPVDFVVSSNNDPNKARTRDFTINVKLKHKATSTVLLTKQRTISFTNVCDNADFFNTPAATPIHTITHVLALTGGEIFEVNIGALLTDKASGGLDNFSKCNQARVYTADASPASYIFDTFTWKDA